MAACSKADSSKFNSTPVKGPQVLPLPQQTHKEVGWSLRTLRAFQLHQSSFLSVGHWTQWLASNGTNL